MISLVYLTLLDTIVVSLILNYFTGKSVKRSYWNYGLFILLASFFSYITSNYTSNYLQIKGLDTAIVSIFFTLLWSYLFKVKFFPTLIAQALSVIFINFVEVPAASFLATSTGESIVIAINNPTLAMLLIGTSCKLFELFLLFLVYKVKFRFLERYDFEGKTNSLVSVAILQISIFILITILITSNLISSKEHTLIIFVSYTLISAIVLTIYLINQRDKEKVFRLQCIIDMQDRTIQLAENSISAIRKEKHDFNNHLNTILGICTTNDLGPINSKVRTYISNITNLYIDESIKPGSGSEYLDALLVAKYHYAKLKDIEIKFNFEYKLCDFETNEQELIAIYGNIIDNAIDALISDTDEGKTKYIELESLSKGKNLILNFYNNGPAIELNKVKRIFDLHFSTKSPETKNRGFGLAIVKECVSRLGGSVSVNSTTERTAFKIVLDGKAIHDQKVGRELS